MKTSTESSIITIRAIIDAPVEKVWKLWTDPRHIIHWNYASDDWQTTRAENDLRVGGKFLSRMEAKDGSTGFDFNGEYLKIENHKKIEYKLADDRKVQVSFESKANKTTVTSVFEAEQMNPVELQKEGWQAILDNFKKYVKTSDKFEIMHFEININAPVEKVYKVMLDEKTYREWTAAFNPTSHYTGSWKKGSKIHFLGTDLDGKMEGMFSKIKENIPNKFISIEHLGVIQDGKEITSGSGFGDWAGALENYSFTEVKAKTLLSVDLDVTHQFKSYFINSWPDALKLLKKICEK